MEVLSRKEAVAKGLKRYYSGKPCKQGHLAERFVSGGCIVCSGQAVNEWKKANRPVVNKWNKVWADANREKVREAVRKSDKKHQTKRKSYQKEWRLENAEKIKQQNEEWRKNNPGLVVEYKRARDSRKLQAMPQWVDRAELRRIYQDRTERYEIDHIIPLVGKNLDGVEVCGLHVPWNLQKISRRLNRSKGSKFYAHQERDFISSHFVGECHLEDDLIVFDRYGFAIQVIDLYFHNTDTGYERRTLQRRIEALREQGLRLYAFYSDEVQDRPQTVLNRISNLMKKSERGPGARNFMVSQIDWSMAREFLDTYHILGVPVHCGINYGAFLDNQLCAVMSFGRPTNNATRQQIELRRFTTDRRSYPGLCSKMFSRFADHYPGNEVVSFSDLRFSDGNVYDQLGFERTGTVPPDYTYCKLGDSKRVHKSNFRKEKIEVLFQVDITGQTEWNLMESLGYTRIYDAGKVRHTKRV